MVLLALEKASDLHLGSSRASIVTVVVFCMLGVWRVLNPYLMASRSSRASIVTVVVFCMLGVWRVLNPYLMASSQFEVIVIR